MRRAILLLTVVVTALVVASGVALAQVVNCPTGANGLCVGTDSADTLNGTSGDDDMRGLKGKDTLNAAAGFDLLSGGRGDDTLNGEGDNDTLNGGPNLDVLNGGAEDDTYVFVNGWGRDTISDGTLGMFGERLTFSLVTEPVTMDLVMSPSRPEAQSGTNRLNFVGAVSIGEVDGSSAGDTIRGQPDTDFLNGIQGSDTVNGRGGIDTVVGMEGNDTLTGGSGGDSFEAGPGADTIKAADNEADSIDCGGGNDTVFFDQGIDTFLNAAACEDKRPM
jgi:Ca2+-binding RTX toxin-like protein